MSDCQHLNFYANVNVARIEDVSPMQFYADITVVCTDCKEPFRFIGVPAGLNPSQPMMSPDGRELRAPIEPLSRGMENWDTHI